MQLHVTDPLFAWARLDDHPELATLKLLLESLPDQELLDSLQRARGHGRDDFPVAVLWGVFVFTIALRHPSFVSCIEELKRNPALYRLLGIAAVADIPKDYNLSRFVDVLGQEPHLSQLRKVFDTQVERLGRVVPDLGQHTAGDSAALNGRAKKDPEAVADEVAQGLPQPCGGTKEYKDDAGNVTKVVTWNGYKHHLLVDVKHEVPLAYSITDPKVGDNEQIKPLVQQAMANLPEGRIETLAYDKAADDVKVHEYLHEQQIKPLIQNRALWQGDKEVSLAATTKKRYPLNVVHDEAGTIYCYDMVSDPPVRHRMAYMGHEKDRETLKYRCPAKHEGWPCPSEQRCNAGRGFGMIVRVDPSIDLRRFPPIPRATKKFEEQYKGRTAVERVNARTKVYWGADDGNLSGSRRFHAYIGVIMVVCVGFATLLAMTRRRDGSMGNTRLSPIALALREATLEGEAEQSDNLAVQPGEASGKQEQTQPDSS
jgi:hypothetical protein